VDVFDAEDYFGLLPRRWRKRLVAAVVTVALLFPGPFQRWYMGQVEQHARELTKQMMKAMQPALDGGQLSNDPRSRPKPLR
jgi:hypothetical protein